MITHILENMFNHLLTQDLLSKQRLTKFAGKTVGFDIHGTEFQFTAQITPEGIEFSNESLNIADCVLRGPPIGLVRYMNASNINPSTNVSLGVEIEGDLDFARHISKIFRNLNIDWTQICSETIGDLPAYQLTKFLSSIRSSLSKSKASAKQNLNYIVSERLDQFVRPDEAEEFYQQIDKISTHAQRLEQKIEAVSKCQQ